MCRSPGRTSGINKHGWKAESVEFARTALNSQALAQGTIQLAISQTLDPLRVIHKGAKIVWLLENNRGEFIIIARKDIKNCKQIDGKRFGIHGETSPVSLASVAWVRECGAKPKVLVLPAGREPDRRPPEQPARCHSSAAGRLAQPGCHGSRKVSHPGRRRRLQYQCVVASNYVRGYWPCEYVRVWKQTIVLTMAELKRWTHYEVSKPIP